MFPALAGDALYLRKGVGFLLNVDPRQVDRVYMTRKSFLPKRCKPPVRGGSAFKGFSLIELVMVVAIIGITSGMVIPRFANSTSLARVNAATNRIIRDAALARQRAMSTSQPRSMVFAAVGYSISGLTSLNNRSPDYAVDLAVEPYKANALTANLGGDAQVTFNIYGVPDSGGTISVTVGGNTRVLTLDANTGLVTAP